MEKIIKIILSARARIVRYIKPKKYYWIATKSLSPISTKYGFDRGTPIDRYWIEDFLKKNKKFIKGRCLEITDSTYSRKFGGSKIKKIDVLDINRKNRKANVYGDLRNLKDKISDNTYDCIILTHVLGLIDEVDKAVSECERILKPGGTILATSSSFSPVIDIKKNYWSFKPAGFEYLFSKHFKKNTIHVRSYGNVLAGQCFWVGMAQEEISRKALKFNDTRFPCIVAARVQK